MDDITRKNFQPEFNVGQHAKSIENIVKIFIQLYQNQGKIYCFSKNGAHFIFILEGMFKYMIAKNEGRIKKDKREKRSNAIKIPIAQKPFVNFPGISPLQPPEVIISQTESVLKEFQNFFQCVFEKPKEIHTLKVRSDKAVFCIMRKDVYDTIMEKAKERNIEK